jgi:CRP-like cAMP-binding protein
LKVGDLVTYAGSKHLENVADLATFSRPSTKQPLMDCQSLAIDAKRFQFLVQQTPNFALHVMRTMADRLRRVDLLLLEAKDTDNAPQLKPRG